MKKMFNLSDNDWWLLKRKIILVEKIVFSLYLLYAFFKIASDMRYIITFFKIALFFGMIATLQEIVGIIKKKSTKKFSLQKEKDID